MAYLQWLRVYRILLHPSSLSTHTWILRSRGKTKTEEKEMVLGYQRKESRGGCVLSVAASYPTQQLLLLLLLHLHPSFTSLLFLHLQKLEQSVRGFLWYDPFASKIRLYQNCMHMCQTVFCNFFTGFANCCSVFSLSIQWKMCTWVHSGVLAARGFRFSRDKEKCKSKFRLRIHHLPNPILCSVC
jgi:hypothetical protein